MSGRQRDLKIIVNDEAGTVRLEITTYRLGYVDHKQQVTFSRYAFERALRDADITLPLRIVNGEPVRS